MRRDILIAFGFWVAAITTPASGPAFAEVDIKTPWANIYVGPGGVFVNGPWGRVDVPASERKRVCAEWRKSTLDYYEERGCAVDFDDEGCVIEDVDCPDQLEK